MATLSNIICGHFSRQYAPFHRTKQAILCGKMACFVKSSLPNGYAGSAQKLYATQKRGLNIVETKKHKN